MQITLQLPPAMAQAYHTGNRTQAELKLLLQTLASLKLELAPLHPDTDATDLQAYFQVDVQDSSSAQQVLEQLQQLPLLEAAYIKPTDEAPG